MKMRDYKRFALAVLQDGWVVLGGWIISNLEQAIADFECRGPWKLS